MVFDRDGHPNNSLQGNSGFQGATKSNISKAGDKIRHAFQYGRDRFGRQLPVDKTPPLTVFHYNGHDVPRPTENGEVWLFSENMDQYHPLSLTDLSIALGSAIYIWDCCQAGLIVEKFFNFSDNRNIPSYHFGACGRDEFRPIRADIPGMAWRSCCCTLTVETFIFNTVGLISKKIAFGEHAAETVMIFEAFFEPRGHHVKDREHQASRVVNNRHTC